MAELSPEAFEKLTEALKSMQAAVASFTLSLQQSAEAIKLAAEKLNQAQRKCPACGYDNGKHEQHCPLKTTTWRQ